MSDQDYNDESSSFSSRVSRYGRVSGTMASLAARLAGERFFGIKIEREKHARQLMEALGNLRGPLMKVGQILATIPEALPREYAEQFQQLQTDAPPMGWPFVRRRMKGELGPDWQDRFQHFDREATNAASLGQVHYAVTHDNREVACKLQYPDMRAAIETDLRQLQFIFSIYERYDNAISTNYIHDELAARLYEELDYDLEARHCKLYHYMLADEACVHVPTVDDELRTSRLLTAEWLHGDRIMNYTEAEPEVRNQLAMNMFRAWYTPLYYYGVIHGDPHMGNYTVRDDLSINLLDFGCVRVFRPKFVRGVIDLYNALMHDDRELAVHAYETWGFEGLSKDQIDTLNIWAEFLYAPLLDDAVRPIGEITSGVYGRQTAEEVHKRLREVGGVQIPREFVFMDRAALGLGSLFLHLNAEINWHQLFEEMIAGFDENALAQRQAAALNTFNVPEPD